MRRAFYIILLLAIAATGLAGMSLGLDHLIYGGEFGAWFFYLGLYWGSLSTVTLAEDVAEWLSYRSHIAWSRRGSLTAIENTRKYLVLHGMRHSGNIPTKLLI